jgi:hypothetical protein
LNVRPADQRGLIGLALAGAAAVALLASDLIVGLAVGAGFYALASRLVRFQQAHR